MAAGISSGPLHRNGRPPVAKPVRPDRRTFFLRRLYRTLRQLVRQRQESSTVKALRWQADEQERSLRRAAAVVVGEMKEEQKKLLEDAETELTETRQEYGEQIVALRKEVTARDDELHSLHELVKRKEADWGNERRDKERTIKDLTEEQIPKLKRELAVALHNVEHLEKLLDKRLTYDEAEIAVVNRRIADAEDVAGAEPMNSPGRRLMRGETP